MYRLSTSRNPLVQAVGLVVGAVAAVGAFLIGAALLAVILGFVCIAALVFFARLWWLRRRWGRTADPRTARRRKADGRRSGPAAGKYVEVEYTVVKERAVGNRDSDG